MLARIFAIKRPSNPVAIVPSCAVHARGVCDGGAASRIVQTHVFIVNNPRTAPKVAQTFFSQLNS